MPLGAGQVFAGIAACVRGGPNVTTRSPVPALSPDMLETVGTDRTALVIDAGGFVGGAVLGGFVAYSLQRAGCRAIVTDGAVRDADEIRGLSMPVYSSAVTPVNGWRRWRILEAGVPVSLPGQSGGRVVVTPGDLILGDGDGVVVVPRVHARTIIEDSEELARIEGEIGKELRGGGARSDVFKRHPRFAHIRPVHGAD